MGQQVSKDELLYQQVNYGNVEGIKTLHREGAGLEWVDGEGKTPLILACMNPELYNVAKTLIELGANVNAYRPGRHAGCPLHHAAKRGLDQTVKLLLTHGANALRMNDDCQTPLEIARAKQYSNVVRAIESHISLFSGWLRQLFGPRFLEALAPQLLSRKIWVVVTPIASSKRKMPLKLVVAMYSSLQDAQPFSTVPLWKAKIEEPMFHQPDPAVVIFNKATRKEFKLASANEGDKQQLEWFCNACRGIPQVRQSTLLPDPHAPTVPVSEPSSTSEDLELAMAIDASIESAIQEGVPILPEGHLTSELSNTNGWGVSATHHQGSGWSHTVRPVRPPLASSSDWLNEPSQGVYNGWGTSETVPSSSNQSEPNIMTSTSNGWENPKPNPDQNICGSSSTGWLDKPAEAGTSSNLSQHSSFTSVQVVNKIPEPASVPSAPPISVHNDDEPVRYPSIDSSPVDLSMPSLETKLEETIRVKEGGDDSSSCVICLDAPIEGACIPCGHMAGCMSCLNEIKTKKWGCPVCRAKINQVLRLYSV